MLNVISKNIFLVVFLLAPVFFISAQKKAVGFPADAKWIKMMNDPNVNYYEAQRVYNEYWKTHKKPADPEDRLNGKEKDDDAKVLSPEEKRLQNRMVYEIKRFENWLREEKPYVQEDGKIMSQKQRNEIWKKQQQELNEQNKTNR